MSQLSSVEIKITKTYTVDRNIQGVITAIVSNGFIQSSHFVGSTATDQQIKEFYQKFAK